MEHQTRGVNKAGHRIVTPDTKKSPVLRHRRRPAIKFDRTLLTNVFVSKQFSYSGAMIRHSCMASVASWLDLSPG